MQSQQKCYIYAVLCQRGRSDSKSGAGGVGATLYAPGSLQVFRMDKIN